MTSSYVWLLLCLPGLEAAKILLFMFPSYSHINGPLVVARDLAERGHMVWNALPSKLTKRTDLQAPGVSTLHYKSLDNYNIDEELQRYTESKDMSIIFDASKKTCDLILRDHQLLGNLREMKFDLIIFDSTPLPRMLTILAYKLDVPFVFLGAVSDPQSSRTPFNPSSTPFPIFPWTPDMNFRVRFLNVIFMLGWHIYNPFTYFGAVATYAPEKPDITMESLVAKGSLWLISQEPLADYPRATLPNVKLVGSLSASKVNPLPEKYKKFMDEAKDGVVIVSFGSNINHFPNGVAKQLVDAFSRTQYRFVFKTGETVSVGPNVLLTDWMPQSDLLAHPNTKLFITHCGASGQSEAFLHGVPMIGFPMFAEQPSNARKLEYLGFGIAMNLASFTVDDLVSNINEVIQNSSYSQKIKKAAEITKLRERSPKDEAVYWIEHVLKYGGAHLRSYCQDMPLYQYLCLDVIGLVLLILHVCVFLLWKSCSYCLRKACNRPKQKRE
ncbi:UDP-glucuronosyltransferase 1A1-like [Haliotis rubra]|uniref:UDP-glucuronosyltransferase 1A1-like n=1 Tax=Haliotis rubra TaxID=36100 RepID=UPI001EE5F795|nr:UDP-glucuronosyltransferase 1A1-like [Haliotis rubra]